MKKNKLAVLTSCLVLSGTFCTQAQNKTPQEIRIPDTYKLTNKSIYRNGWIDFNKNGNGRVYGYDYNDWFDNKERVAFRKFVPSTYEGLNQNYSAKYALLH